MSMSKQDLLLVERVTRLCYRDVLNIPLQRSDINKLVVNGAITRIVDLFNLCVPELKRLPKMTDARLAEVLTALDQTGKTIDMWKILYAVDLQASAAWAKSKVSLNVINDHSANDMISFIMAGIRTNWDQPIHHHSPDRITIDTAITELQSINGFNAADMFSKRITLVLPECEAA